MKPEALVDANRGVAEIESVGGFYQLMKSGLNLNALRTNDLLRKDEWKAYDTAIVDVAREQLVGVADLMSRGLVRNLGGLGVLIDEWETASDMSDADVDVAAVTAGTEDSVDYQLTGVPIPIIHKSYRINYRRLLASRRFGRDVDTVQAEVAGIKVMEKSEDILFNGYTMKLDGRNLYGYTTFPSRVTVSISGSWDTTPANIISDVEALLSAADAVYYRGPFMLYVPTAFWSALRSDQNVYLGKTYYDRIKEYPEIIDVKLADKMTAGEVVLVQMTRNVVDLSVGSDITNVRWTTMGGLVLHMKVMAAWAPRLKADANGSSGIIHGS